jgi:hypothetical protein
MSYRWFSRFFRSIYRFWQKLFDFWQNSSENVTSIFRKNHRFIGEIGRLIIKTRLNSFLLLIRTLRCGSFCLNFTDFSKSEEITELLFSCRIFEHCVNPVRYFSITVSAVTQPNRGVKERLEIPAAKSQLLYIHTVGYRALNGIVLWLGCCPPPASPDSPRACPAAALLWVLGGRGRRRRSRWGRLRRPVSVLPPVSSYSPPVV